MLQFEHPLSEGDSAQGLATIIYIFLGKMDCNRLHKLAATMHHRFMIVENVQQTMNNVRAQITLH